jgi:hypothetical protein
MPAVTFCKESVKISYHCSAFREEQMLIKYSNVYQTKDKAKRIGVNKYVYTLSFMVVMPHLPKQIRQRKKFKNGQSRSLAFN